MCINNSWICIKSTCYSCFIYFIIQDFISKSLTWLSIEMYQNIHTHLYFLSFFHFVNNVYKFKTYVWLLYHLFQKDNVLSLTKIKVCNRWFEHIWMHGKGLKVRQHGNTLIHSFVKTTMFFFKKRSEIKNKNSTKWNHQDRVVKWFGREETR